MNITMLLSNDDNELDYIPDNKDEYSHTKMMSIPCGRLSSRERFDGHDSIW